MAMAALSLRTGTALNPVVAAAWGPRDPGGEMEAIALLALLVALVVVTRR
jgi:hypothetical protein